MIKKLAILLTFILSISLNAGDKVEKITLAGPAANVSHPLLVMIKQKMLEKYAKKVEFKLWDNPDQLRAMVMNKEVDFVAVPTNVGSILYNKKQPIKLLNVSIWGILKILTTDEKAKTLSALKGKEIVVPWRGDMPDIVLQTLLKNQKLSDIKIKYVSNPMDAAQQLIMRRADNILLPEPAASMVLAKTKSFPAKVVAPDTYIGIDLQDEWGKTFNTEPKIPQAGVAVVGKTVENKELVDAFKKAYADATAWYKEHPKEAGELVAKNIKMFTAQAVADSIARVKLDVVDAKDAKDKIEFFFNKLKEYNPKIIGGNLPDKGFYY